jgi:hypothetical protein
MRQGIGFSVIAVALVAAGAASICAAQTRLSPEGLGLGLRPQPGAIVEPLSTTDSVPAWQPRQSSDFTLYGGARELPAFGLGPAETYSGVTYALPWGLGTSFEAVYTQESRFAPRRYAVAGEIRTELSGGSRALSAGLQYRIYDTDSWTRAGIPADTPVTSAYSLARDPGYQLQLSYQHSAATSFGLALGRDVETYTSSFDPTITAPRQLTFMGQHWLTPAWALSYDLLYNDPSNMSTLRFQGLGLRLGVRYRF